MSRRQTGNGERCPLEPEHGQMLVLQSGNQWCPSQEHDRKKQLALFGPDGKTPIKK